MLMDTLEMNLELVWELPGDSSQAKIIAMDLCH